MAWIFETKCPKCGLVNKRYHNPWDDGYTLVEVPSCLGVTCECLYEYIAVADPVACIGCAECTWYVRGFLVKVLDPREVTKK
jgi:hypothetical protein